MILLLKVRVASFNVALNRGKAGKLAVELGQGSPQIRNLAQILQHIRPDIVLLNEFDHDGEGVEVRHLQLFCQQYLDTGEQAIAYPYYYLVPTNTGLLAPVSLTGQGRPKLPEDGLGFGAFHGQYAMAILSKYPLLVDQARSFRYFLWRDMPDARLPQTEQGHYYDTEVLGILPLSSKNHLDLPVQLPNNRVLHLLASHPAPPIDEGPERRNSCRNHDELRLWHDYIRPEHCAYLQDDNGRQGGLGADEDFVIVGDLNADPQDGDGFRSSIQTLLANPKLNQAVSLGSLRPAARGGFALKMKHTRRGSAKYWTYDKGLRLDYVLPAAHLPVLNSGVYWPTPNKPHAELFWNRNSWPQRKASSDHRLVWVDIVF